MRRMLFAIFYLALLALSPLIAHARLTVTMSIKEMFEEADVIARIEVLNVKGQGRAKFTDSQLKDRSFIHHVAILHPDENVSRVRILRLIKGTLGSKEDTVRFYSSKSEILASLSPGERALVFLKRQGDELLPVDVDNWKLPATAQRPNPKASFPDATARFIDELRLMAADGDSDVAAAGLDGLSQFPGSDSQNVIREFTHDSRPKVRDRALAAGAVSGDPDAEMEMLNTLMSPQMNTPNPHGTEDQRTRTMFMRSIENSAKSKNSSPERTDMLLKLVDHKDRGIRISALDALRKLKSPKSIPTLIRLLDDPDQFVQYQAAMTLCEMNSPGGTGCPSIMLFSKSPDKYREQWKAWWVKHQSEKK